jgi:hypothetical protein
MFITDILNDNVKKYSKYEFGKLFKKNYNELKDLEFFKNIFEKIQTNKSKYVYRYLNDDFGFCKNCGKVTFKLFCCHYCACEYNNSHRSEEMKKKILEKTKQTNLEKYGVEFSVQSENVKNKAKQTNLEKYGFKYTFQSEVVKDKIKETNLKKYGVENVSHSKEIREKTKQTNLKKYGFKYGFQNEAVKDKIKETNLEKYGVENVNYRNFKNLENFNEEYIRKNFIKDGLFLRKEFSEYFNCSYANTSKYKRTFKIKEPSKVEIINFQGISKSEKELVDFIKKTHTVIENDRNILNPLELDIVIPQIKLAIEYNGVYWHSNVFKDKNYHLDKLLKCLEKGIKLFTIFETDNLEIWKSMISNKLGLNKRIYARQCEIREISNETSRVFLEENHLQGYCTSKIRYGLFYENELVQIITFGKSRFNKDYDFELLRLCTKKFITVIGGTSKLFKHFLKNNNGSIISYANRRFSDGAIYKILGFKEINKTSPNYFYLVNHTLESRIKFQKHKLKNILENFDENLTEQKNMELNGFKWIYDCGNLVFEFKNG